MEILSIHLNNLRNEEHFKFHTDFVVLVTRYAPAAIGIETLFSQFQITYRKEEAALNIIRKSAVTDDLAVADALRDATFSGLATAVKAATNHFKPEVKAAAQRAQVLFDNYGNVSTKPYDQETAAISDLLTQIGDTYNSDMDILGLLEWSDTLSAQNEAFDQLKKKRYTEESIKPLSKMKEVRIETDAAYKAIVKRIHALIEINGEKAYHSFVAELNQYITSYNNLTAQRQGRNAKEAKSTTEIKAI